MGSLFSSLCMGAERCILPGRGRARCLRAFLPIYCSSSEGFFDPKPGAEGLTAGFVLLSLKARQAAWLRVGIVLGEAWGKTGLQSLCSESPIKSRQRWPGVRAAGAFRGRAGEVFRVQVVWLALGNGMLRHTNSSHLHEFCKGIWARRSSFNFFFL